MWNWMKVFGYKIERVGEIRWRCNDRPLESLRNRIVEVEEKVLDTFFLWKTVEGDH